MIRYADILKSIRAAEDRRLRLSAGGGEPEAAQDTHAPTKAFIDRRRREEEGVGTAIAAPQVRAPSSGPAPVIQFPKPQAPAAARRAPVSDIHVEPVQRAGGAGAVVMGAAAAAVDASVLFEGAEDLEGVRHVADEFLSTQAPVDGVGLPAPGTSSAWGSAREDFLPAVPVASDEAGTGTLSPPTDEDIDSLFDDPAASPTEPLVSDEESLALEADAAPGGTGLADAARTSRAAIETDDDLSGLFGEEAPAGEGAGEDSAIAVEEAEAEDLDAGTADFDLERELDEADAKAGAAAATPADIDSAPGGTGIADSGDLGGQDLLDSLSDMGMDDAQAADLLGEPEAESATAEAAPAAVEVSESEPAADAAPGGTGLADAAVPEEAGQDRETDDLLDSLTDLGLGTDETASEGMDAASVLEEAPEAASVTEEAPDETAPGGTGLDDLFGEAEPSPAPEAAAALASASEDDEMAALFEGLDSPDSGEAAAAEEPPAIAAAVPHAEDSEMSDLLGELGIGGAPGGTGLAHEAPAVAAAPAEDDIDLERDLFGGGEEVMEIAGGAGLADDPAKAEDGALEDELASIMNGRTESADDLLADAGVQDSGAASGAGGRDEGDWGELGDLLGGLDDEGAAPAPAQDEGANKDPLAGLFDEDDKAESKDDLEGLFSG